MTRTFTKPYSLIEIEKERVLVALEMTEEDVFKLIRANAR
jgi:hypothetical protein